MKQKLFYIDYDNTQNGCPIFIGGQYYQNDVWTGEHEWDFDNPNPYEYDICMNYRLKFNENFINFDYGDDLIVSQNFFKNIR